MCEPAGSQFTAEECVKRNQMSLRKWLKRGVLLFLAYLLLNLLVVNAFNPLYSRIVSVSVFDRDTKVAIAEVEITQIRTGKDDKQWEHFATATDEVGNARIHIIHSEKRTWALPLVPKPTLRGRWLRFERSGYETKIIDLSVEIPDISAAPRELKIIVLLKKQR